MWNLDEDSSGIHVNLRRERSRSAGTLSRGGQNVRAAARAWDRLLRGWRPKQNRLPEYVLAIQQCAEPRISIAFLVASCLDTCALQQILVGFLQHTEFVCIAFQDDCIVSRMKNSAKMLPHLFTQTNENRRLITQYRCHFRR